MYYKNDVLDDKYTVTEYASPFDAQNIRTQKSELEELLDFKREISIMYFKSIDNSDGFFPLSENYHKDGILKKTIAPATLDENIKQLVINIKNSFKIWVKY